MDEEDIFSSVNEFCKDNKLDKDFEKTINLNQNFVNRNSTSDTFNDLISGLTSTSTSKKPSKSRASKKSINKSTSAVASTSKQMQSNPGRSTRSRRTKKNKQIEETDNLNISTSTPSTNSLSETSQPSQTNVSMLQNILESAMSSRSKGRSKSSKQKSTSPRQTLNKSNANLLTNDSFVVPQTTQTRRNRNARRNYIGEIAARAQVVGYVDLASSPVVLPQNIGVINVDSDEETVATKSMECSIENIDEVEKTPLSVKVKWGKKIEVFPYRKYQKFSDIIKHFAELEKVNKENVCLNLGNRILSENDTPESVNYEVHMFIHGRMVEDCINPVTKHNIKDVNLLEVKIQCDGRKRPIMMTLKKSNKFSVLYAKCAEEFQVPVSKIRLSFDGELLKDSITPQELDFEGGELIDCKIKS